MAHTRDGSEFRDALAVGGIAIVAGLMVYLLIGSGSPVEPTGSNNLTVDLKFYVSFLVLLMIGGGGLVIGAGAFFTSNRRK